MGYKSLELVLSKYSINSCYCNNHTYYCKTNWSILISKLTGWFWGARALAERTHRHHCPFHPRGKWEGLRQRKQQQDKERCTWSSLAGPEQLGGAMVSTVTHLHRLRDLAFSFHSLLPNPEFVTKAQILSVYLPTWGHFMQLEQTDSLTDRKHRKLFHTWLLRTRDKHHQLSE